MRILLYFLLILLVGCSSGQNKKTHERVDLDSVPVYIRFCQEEETHGRYSITEYIIIPKV